MSPEERSSVDKYKLGGLVVYNSAAAQAQLAKVAAGMAGGSLLSGAVGLAMSKFTLTITVDSLTRGQHIECKDLDELLGAEAAIQGACQSIHRYIDVAKTFDGRELVFDVAEMATA